MSIASRKASINSNIRLQTTPGSITPDIVSDEMDGILDEVAGMLPFEVAATYAAISPSIAKRLILVSADENNNGNTSLYFYTGSAIIGLFTFNPTTL